MSKKILKTELSKLYGKPSWNVHKGYSSILSLNFGQPRLNIHKPKTIKGKQSRFTQVRGEWVLWIFGCNWKYFREDILAGRSESSTLDIRRVARDINGQALVKVIFEKEAKVIFYFDLGGRLETTPYGKNEDVIDQWVLFDSRGYATNFDTNGKISRQLANQPRK